MSRIRRPETTRLSISQGDWLVVKTRLNSGEQRHVYARMVKSMVAGEKIEINPLQAGLSTMVEYLLDWSITDPDGKPVVIRDQPADVVAAALDALEMESFNEILKAITDHEAAMTAAREQEKKQSAGVTNSSPTSPSLDDATGPSTTSVN